MYYYNLCIVLNVYQWNLMQKKKKRTNIFFFTSIGFCDWTEQFHTVCDIQFLNLLMFSNSRYLQNTDRSVVIIICLHAVCFFTLSALVIFITTQSALRTCSTPIIQIAPKLLINITKRFPSHTVYTHRLSNRQLDLFPSQRFTVKCRPVKYFM